MDDYKGSHKAPNSENDAPLHELTKNGIYPEDVYSNKAAHYYGHGNIKEDKELFSKIHSLKEKPDALIDIHRAIPRDTPRDSKINKGDWVTIHKNYAREHGEGRLKGEFRILSMKVPAKHLFTNGDSAYEWGYHPEEAKKAK